MIADMVRPTREVIVIGAGIMEAEDIEMMVGIEMLMTLITMILSIMKIQEEGMVQVEVADLMFECLDAMCNSCIIEVSRGCGLSIRI